MLVYFTRFCASNDSIIQNGKAKCFDSVTRTALLCGGGVLVIAEQCQKIGAYAIHLSVSQMRFHDFIDDAHKYSV